MMKNGFKPGFTTSGFDEMRPVFRSARMDPWRNKSSKQEETAYDVIEKHLESAQALAEFAAHQFLRCGDCSSELEGMRGRLESVLEAARSEVRRLQNELAKGQDGRPIVETKLNGVVNHSKLDRIPTDGIDGTIEVDDGSDSSSISIDLKAFRKTPRR
jgi:hypothetical protein